MKKKKLLKENEEPKSQLDILDKAILNYVGTIPNSRHLPKKDVKDGDIYYAEEEAACCLYVYDKWYKYFNLETLAIKLLTIDDTDLTFEKINELLKPYDMYMVINIEMKPRITYYEVKTYKEETYTLISEVWTSRKDYLKYACQKLGTELMVNYRYKTQLFEDE